jgi:L-lactate dehydrogenase (cytochrome)
MPALPDTVLCLPDTVLCLPDLDAAAQAHLPRPIWAYVSGGVEDNVSLHANRAEWEALRLVPRLLRDVSNRDAGVELFGRHYGQPFGIAPMGLAALSGFEADLAMARAAEAAGIPFILSGSSLVRMEEVVAAAPSAWFQAYLPGQPERIDALLDRVQAAGFKHLVITVDLPVQANRENLVRAGFSIPLRPSGALLLDGLSRPAWLFGTLARTLLRRGMPHFENLLAERNAPVFSRHVLRDFSGREHLDWSHLRAIRARWDGLLLVKGLLSADDARLAHDAGVDGLIVSNHGGRQLDSAITALAALPAIREAVPNMVLLLDGGIRRGTDVVKALALGANAVLVGRPFNYAAALGGQAGVAAAIDILATEFSRDMALIGVSNPAQLDASFVGR